MPTKAGELVVKFEGWSKDGMFGPMARFTLSGAGSREDIWTAGALREALDDRNSPYTGDEKALFAGALMHEDAPHPNSGS